MLEKQLQSNLVIVQRLLGKATELNEKMEGSGSDKNSGVSPAAITLQGMANQSEALLYELENRIDRIYNNLYADLKNEVQAVVSGSCSIKSRF